MTDRSHGWRSLDALPPDETPSLPERVAAIERELRASRAADAYARVYAALAAATLAITFLPLHTRINPQHLNDVWPSLWGLNQANGLNEPGMALVVNEVLFFSLAEIVFLIVAAFWAPRTKGIPIAIGTLAVLNVMLIASSEGVPTTVTLSGAGRMAIVTGILTVVVCTTHAVRSPFGDTTQLADDDEA